MAWLYIKCLFTITTFHCLLHIATAAPLAVTLSQSWRFWGPFQYGKTEYDSEPPFGVAGGILGLLSMENRQQRHRFESELVAGGFVTEQALVADAHGGVNISPAVDWNTLIQSISHMEILEWRGFAVSNLVVTKRTRIKIKCGGVVSFYLLSPNTTTSTSLGVPFAGDIYNSGRVSTIATLEPATYSLLVNVRAKAQATFACSASPLKASWSSQPLQVLGPLPIAPDVWVDGAVLGRHATVYMQNLAIYPIRNLSCRLRLTSTPGGSESIAAAISAAAVISTLAPAQSGVIPCFIPVPPASACALCSTSHQRVDVVVEVTGCVFNPHTRAACKRVAAEPVTHSLRCRALNESATFTFIDHDGSVQQAALIPPLGPTNSRNTAAAAAAIDSAPVLMTFHGTGVSAQSQADSYKVKLGRATEYSFGVEEYWVLAPTRFGAHNWQGTGLLSAFSALDALAALTAPSTAAAAAAIGAIGTAAGGRGAAASCANTARLPPADATRVLFTGHSMGGHGALHAATVASDIALAAAPLSLWLSKEGYGDSNTFMGLDASEPFVDPHLRGVLLSSVLDQRADTHIANLGGLPLHIRVGASDRTTPPYYARRLLRLAAAEGVSAVFEEVKDKEHWWWDTAVSNDGGVVNDDVMRRFYAAHVHRESGASLMMRAAHAALQPTDDDGSTTALPLHFTLLSSNPGVYTRGRAGIRILALNVPATLAKVAVRRRSHSSTSTSSSAASLHNSHTRISSSSSGPGREAVEAWYVTSSNARRLRITLPTASAAASVDVNSIPSLAGVCAAAPGTNDGGAPHRLFPTVICIDGTPFSPVDLLSRDVCLEDVNSSDGDGSALHWRLCSRSSAGGGEAENNVSTETCTSAQAAVSVDATTVLSAAAAAAAATDDPLSNSVGSVSTANDYNNVGSVSSSNGCAAEHTVDLSSTGECAAEHSSWDFERTSRGPHNSGPMRQVTSSRFTIVIGTLHAEATAAFAAAAELIAHLHLIASDTHVAIVNDTDLTLGVGPCHCGTDNIYNGGTNIYDGVEHVPLPCCSNLILLGSHAQNAWTGAVRSGDFSCVRAHATAAALRIDGDVISHPSNRAAGAETPSSPINSDSHLPTREATSQCLSRVQSLSALRTFPLGLLHAGAAPTPAWPASFSLQGAPRSARCIAKAALFQPGQLGAAAVVGWWDPRADRVAHRVADGSNASSYSSKGNACGGDPPGPRLALILSASGEEGFSNLLSLAESTIPPMVRAPFSNLFPDLVITGNELKLRGLGGVVAAGYFDSAWQWAGEASYLAC